MWKTVLILCGGFLALSFLHFAAKKKKPFRRAFLSMGLGLAALAAVDLLASVTNVYVPVTALSVAVSAIGGAPGVALLVMLSVI